MSARSQKFAYVTIVTSQDYVFAAQTMAKSLKRYTTYPIVAIVNKHIHYQPLESFFDTIVPVEPIISKDSRIDLIERPLESTFTKFYAWTLTDFDKVVYLDSDMIVLQNIDDLFQKDELSAAPDVGWPDCFNSGLMVLKPDYIIYEELRFQAVEFGSFDGADQGLLNDYFPNWNRLPFTYNVTVSVAPVYSYKPAYLRYKDNVKVLHYFGATKPWNHQHSSNSVINELLQKWWDVANNNSSPSSQKGKIASRKTSRPSGHNDDDEPQVLSYNQFGDVKTVLINNREFVVDNNQAIPYNPYHNTNHDNRQQNLNVETMVDFANYRCDWNYDEMYEKKRSKSPKKNKSIFKANSWVDLKTLRNVKQDEEESDDENEEVQNYMALSRESLFDKRYEAMNK